MANFLAAIRNHVYPRRAIEQKLLSGEMRASSAMWGMASIIAGTLVVAHIVMLVAGV